MDVYFDIETVAKIQKLHKKFRDKGVNRSKVIRMFVASKTFDDAVEELNNQLEA